jgi:GDPmannose 4,6-dehydratase
MTKAALVTGITGQDGAFLAQLLLNKGYTVYGTIRRNGNFNSWRLKELGIDCHDRLHFRQLDLTDSSACIRLIEECGPTEVYNFAAPTLVGFSFQQPAATAMIAGIGAVNLLEAICTVDKSIRFFQASSSEMFGNVATSPQVETTHFHPRNPYGAAKLYAHWMTVNYRENNGIFASSGISYNHESPLRGIEFVTRKITDAVARISVGQQDVLEIGNLDAERDWGYAQEYVEGSWRMLQTDEPDTYILSTGATNSVRDFTAMAFKAAEVEIDWKGDGKDETGICARTGKTLVRVNAEFYRPLEVGQLVGDASKAQRELGWRATTSLEELCSMMVKADMARQRDE